MKKKFSSKDFLFLIFLERREVRESLTYVTIRLNFRHKIITFILLKNVTN